MPFRDRSAHRRSFSLGQFCEITNAEIRAAEEFLSKHKFADIDEAVLQYLHDKESNDDDGEEAKQYEYDTPKDRQQYQAVTTSRGRATTTATKSTHPNSDKNIQMDTPIVMIMIYSARLPIPINWVGDYPVYYNQSLKNMVSS